MKKNKLYILAVFGITSVTAFAGVEEHNNSVCAYNSSDGNQLIMMIDSNYSYSITDGQPFSGVDNVSGCIDIHSGNKKSTNVVNWVKKQMLADNVDWVKRNMGANIMYHDDMPNELNVAVKGNFTLIFRDTLNFTTKTYYCPNLILAQGSTHKLVPTIFPIPVIGVPTNDIWLMSNLQNDKYRGNKTIFNCYDSSNNSLQKMMMFRNQGTAEELIIGLFESASSKSDIATSNLVNNNAVDNAAANDEINN